MTEWQILALLAGATALTALALLYRLARTAMEEAQCARADASGLTQRVLDNLTAMQQSQTTIVSELLAHRTLAETGNMHIAGAMLQHSNAHDFRAQAGGDLFTPASAAAPESGLPGPHESGEMMFGEEEEFEPPRPGAEP